MPCILAIETSCDETAVSVLDFSAVNDPSKAVLAELVSSQVNLHQAYGGVVPELAAREHLLNLPLLYEQAMKLAVRDASDVRAVAVTRGPGLKGCLLVGLSFAKGLALSLGRPLLALNHLEGHIFAGHLVAPATYPMLVLLVSGGHTLLVLANGERDYEIISQTLDDAVGEAFDKSATLLGLPYPGGPALARLAERGDSQAFSFPVGMPQESNYFSFSGVKTAVLRAVENVSECGLDERTRFDLAASIQASLVRALLKKSLEACKKIRPKSFLLTGGVAANQHLRESLGAELKRLGIKLIVPPPKWCTDNATMMAVLAAHILKTDSRYDSWQPGVDLGPDTDFQIAALPRWPVA